MDDYLSKPIELRQLGLLIAKWLGDDSLKSDGRIDDAAMEAYRPGSLDFTA